MKFSKSIRAILRQADSVHIGYRSYAAQSMAVLIMNKEEATYGRVSDGQYVRLGSGLCVSTHILNYAQSNAIRIANGYAPEEVPA